MIIIIDKIHAKYRPENYYWDLICSIIKEG